MLAKRKKEGAQAAPEFSRSYWHSFLFNLGTPLKIL